MTQFLPVSTSQLGGDTNPYRGSVILQGSTTLVMTAQGTGNGATANIALPLDTANFFLYPIASSTLWNLGAGTFYTYPLPFSHTSMSTGLVQRSGSLYIETSAKPTSYTLHIDVWDRTIAQSLTINYKILAYGF